MFKEQYMVIRIWHKSAVMGTYVGSGREFMFEVSAFREALQFVQYGISHCNASQTMVLMPSLPHHRLAL